MYTPGDSDAIKHCYDVYLRMHAITGTGHWDSLPSISAWTQDGFIRSNDAAETVLVQYKDENTVTNYYIAPDDLCWCKIGVLKAEPAIITEEGEKIPLATCNDKVISKKVAIDFTSLSVNKDNWEMMLILKEYNVDVLFVETSNVTAATAGNGKGAANLQMDVNLNIKGNAIDEMPFKLTKEVGVIQKFVNFLDVQL